MSRVVSHLRGERGRVSCHSSGSLEWGCPSSAEVIEDTEDFIQFEGLYSRYTVFETFPYLRDFLKFFWFDTFFLKFEKFSKARYQRFLHQRFDHIFTDFFHFATCTLCKMHIFHSICI